MKKFAGGLIAHPFKWGHQAGNPRRARHAGGLADVKHSKVALK
jgi:hypothetical protein